MDCVGQDHKNGDNIANQSVNNNPILYQTKDLNDKIQVDSSEQTKSWNDLPSVIVSNILGHIRPSKRRLKVSSVCKAWRSVIYQPSLWPVKHLNVNLCSFKFALQYQETQEDMCYSGIYMFNFLPYHKRSPNQKSCHLRYFLQKCSRFLEGITIYFDPNSRFNVKEVIKIIKHLSEDELSIYQLENDPGILRAYSNCRALKFISFAPVTAQTRVDHSFIDLYCDLIETLKNLMIKCQSLEHVSLGAIETLLTPLDDYLKLWIRSGHHKTLRCLHLGTCKSNLLLSQPIPSISVPLLIEHFISLRFLTLDFDLCNTKLVTSLASLKSLESITLNVHRNRSSHQGISKEAWTLVHSRLPKLKSTVNLLNIHSNQLIPNLITNLIDTDLPIENFRAYYLEPKEGEKLYNLLEALARRNSGILRSLVLIDHLNKPNRILVDQSPNPLTMLAWQCKFLEEITIIGFILDDIDLVAIARLRGRFLRQLNIPGSCVKLTRQLCANKIRPSVEELSYFNQFSDRWFFDTAPIEFQKSVRYYISVPLKRIWHPLFDNKIPVVMFNSMTIPQLTYHRTIAEQRCLCKQEQAPIVCDEQH